MGEPTSPAPGPSGGPRRRRRRRRKPGGGDSKTNERSPAREKTALAENVIRGVPKLENQSTDVPLSEAEREVLKEHFAFLRRHRKNLRLKLNAQEDLLLNGARDPENRGVCLHLLQKIDHSAVQGALARMVTPEQKQELLEGVVKISSDLAILLLYLETLAVTQSRAAAAAALTVGLGQIDFSTASAAQMRRILELLVDLFGPEERPGLVFGLLRSPTFREAFDATQEKMPEGLAELLLPLRAVHAVVLQGQPNPADTASLHAGVDLLLNAGAGTLKAYPEAVRKRLLQHGLSSRAESARTSMKPVTALLESFPPKSREFSRYALQLAGALLARHQDDAARTWLQRLVQEHPDFRLPRRWLAELDKPRIGRVAIDSAPEQPNPRALLRGFWLDVQRPVWVRRTSSDEEVTLQGHALVPNVLPVLEHRDGLVMLADRGQPAAPRLGNREVPVEQRMQWALDGVALLHALGGLGVELPDLKPDRFLIDGRDRLWLASFAGAHRSTDALEHHLELARTWARDTLRGAKGAGGTREQIAQDLSWTELARALC